MHPNKESIHMSTSPLLSDNFLLQNILSEATLPGMPIHPSLRMPGKVVVRFLPSLLWLWALLGGLLSIRVAAADPLISEFTAAGQSVLSDEESAFPDWLEIFNPGPDPVDLAGWHLTDQVANPAKWTFPSRTLASGEFLVVFMSGKDRAFFDGPLHANFRLSSRGETVALARPDGTISQQIVYPVQIPDFSYDGIQFLSRPTPGAPNAAPLIIAPFPQFGVDHGYFSAPFNLELSTSSPATIRYTLDGTEPTASHGTEYLAPIRITRTTTIRAGAFVAGARPSPVLTKTYLFMTDVVKQSPNGKAPDGWPRKWGQNKVDYGMDARITQRPPTGATIREDLRTIPAVSIVMDLSDLFDPVDGIYANPGEKGDEWEHPMSIEWITPDGAPGFQVNAGIRIRGGASRDSSNPKHSFRILLRKEYGAPELKYPLFAGSEFASRFDLRCEQLISWHYSPSAEADFMRDIFGRKSQLAVGAPAKDGQFVHLYINGMYWGLYNTDERVTGDYGSYHFGGGNDDYDVVKFDAEANFGTGNSTGTFASWRRLFDAGVRGFDSNVDYFKVQGLNPDGSRNRDYERLLDVDNLIDYMLVGIYCAASDNPPSGGVQNNWYSIKSRKGDFGYRFFVHDFELAMYGKDDDVVEDEPVEDPFGSVEPGSTNMWHYWQALRRNAEFRLRVADHVQKHFFNGGALSTEACTARWQSLMDEIDRAIVGESARWGDSGGGKGGGGGPIFGNPPFFQPPARTMQEGIPVSGPIKPGPSPRPGGGGSGEANKPKPYKRKDWLQAAQGKLDNYFPFRSEIVLQQLRDAHLLPAVQAPVLSATESLSIENPNASGTIFYTVDGSDPRRIGGAISTAAVAYAAPIHSAQTITVRARIKDGDTWSPLAETTFTPATDFGGLIVTEIYYRPAVGDPGEFIELKNTGATPLDLSGCTFTAGITYTFPNGTILAPASFVVLGRDAETFSWQHPGVQLDGIYTGRLANEGETLTLASATGQTIFSFAYDNEAPWPGAADGLDFSIVRAREGDPADPESWRASAVRRGSPRADDPAPPVMPKVVINEVLANQDPSPGAIEAFVEVHNLESTSIDLSGWAISNAPISLSPFIVPTGILLPPGGYAVFRQSDFANTTTVLSASGGDLYLTSANPALSYIHAFHYGVSPEGMSIGRVVTSDGREQFTALANPTPGADNAAPSVAFVRVSEIHYAPVEGEDEFVELENDLIAPASVGQARLNGLGYTFPPDAAIPAHGHALIVTIDPQNFRTKYDIPASVPIYGPAPGTLQDNGELVSLDIPTFVEGEAGYLTIDAVRYNDRRPWPTLAAGLGGSLQRLPGLYFGGEPRNWVAAKPTPGTRNSVNPSPLVRLTSPQNLTDVVPPAVVHFAAEASDLNGAIAKVQFLVDHLVVGEDSDAPYELDWTPTPGLHDLTAVAIDDAGAATESDFVTINVDAPEGGTGLGLRGEYFANTTFSGAPVVRNDAQVNFDWVETPPINGVPRKNFSVRWTGRLGVRRSGEQQLAIATAGHVRLFINGQLILDDGNEAASKGQIEELSALVNLDAGEPAEIVLEYVDTDGFAHIELKWNESGGFEFEAIPETQLYLPGQDPHALGITTASVLPTRQRLREFQTRFQAANGRRPYAWSVVSGSVPSGVNLSTDGLLSGATSDTGTYQFTLKVTDQDGVTAEKSFRMQVFDSAGGTRPVVEILQPGSGTEFKGEEPIVVNGRVVSNRPLSDVSYSVNFGPWHTLPQKRNWSFRLTPVKGLQAGSNTVRVVARDVDGRESGIARRTFRRIVHAPLTVSIRGSGTISPGFIGTTDRIVGQRYTIVATPAQGFIFSQWEGQFSQEPRLSFTMEEGLNLVAVFERNPYPALADHYIGLIGGDHETHAERGYADLKLTPTGAFTMALQFGGKKYPIRGRFDGAGFFFANFSNTPNGNDGFLSMQLLRDQPSVTVDITVNRFDDPVFISSQGFLARSPWKAGSRPCPVAGTYNVVVGPGANPLPETSTNATLTIDATGVATYDGELPDGTHWRSVVRIPENASVPTYAALYGSRGSFSGTLYLIITADLVGQSQFLWSRPADSNDPNYPDGFSGFIPISATPAAISKDGSSPE